MSELPVTIEMLKYREKVVTLEASEIIERMVN